MHGRNTLIIAVVILLAFGCETTPPELTPDERAELEAHRAQTATQVEEERAEQAAERVTLLGLVDRLQEELEEARTELNERTLSEEARAELDEHVDALQGRIDELEERIPPEVEDVVAVVTDPTLEADEKVTGSIGAIAPALPFPWNLAAVLGVGIYSDWQRRRARNNRIRADREELARIQEEKRRTNLGRVVAATQRFGLIKDDKVARDGAKDWAGAEAHLELKRTLTELATGSAAA